MYKIEMEISFKDGIVEDIKVKYNGFTKNDILNVAKGYSLGEAKYRIVEKMNEYEAKQKPKNVSGGDAPTNANVNDVKDIKVGVGQPKVLYFDDDDEDELPQEYKMWKKVVLSLFKVDL